MEPIFLQPASEGGKVMFSQVFVNRGKGGHLLSSGPRSFPGGSLAFGPRSFSEGWGRDPITDSFRGVQSPVPGPAEGGGVPMSWLGYTPPPDRIGSPGANRCTTPPPTGD